MAKASNIFGRSLALSAVILLLNLSVPNGKAVAQETPSLPGQFAYVEDGARLYLVRGNVHDPVLLTQAEADLGLENPRFSPDGRYLVYCIHNLQAEDIPTLYSMDTLTLEKHQVTTDGSCSYDWSPDGKTLIFSTPAFLEGESSMPDGIWSYSLETGAIELIIPTNVPVINPRWSPDGHTLSYFDFCFECVGQFYTYDLTTKETKEWSQEDSDHTIGPDVDWSPDGGSLAYDKALWMYTGEGDTFGLEVANSGGEIRQEIHSLPGRGAYFPIWSPDGERIAFASFESFTIGNYINRRGDLMTVAPDGSEAKTLYTSFFEVFPQTWSPDGRYLLFVEPLSVTQDSVQKQQLVLLDLDTGGLIWKVSSFDAITADWAPIAEAPATVTVVPAVSAADGTPPSLGTEESVSSGDIPPTEGSSPTNMQDDIPGGIDSLVLFSVLLWLGALIAIVILMFYLWRWSKKASKQAPAPVQESHVVEKPAPEPSHEEVEAAFQQGVELVRAGKAQEGIAELSKVITDEPENDIAWFWLGIASVRLKDYRSAERCFLQAKRHGHSEADKALEWLKGQAK